MQLDKYFYLGKILKTIGISGDLMVHLDVDDPMRYQNLDAIFIALGGNLVPFIIERVKLKHNNQAQIKLREIDSVEQTEILIGCTLYLPLELLPKLKGNQFYYHEIIGFEVTDSRFGPVGRVELVLEFPLQAILQLNFAGKEVLIPVADDIITSVDRENRRLIISAPEGLIEMYLG